MRVLLVGPDDVLPSGKLAVNLPACPREGELVVWVRRGAPSQYFRVTEVCWIFEAESAAELRPEIAVEPVDGP